MLAVKNALSNVLEGENVLDHLRAYLRASVITLLNQKAKDASFIVSERNKPLPCQSREDVMGLLLCLDFLDKKNFKQTMAILNPEVQENLKEIEEEGIRKGTGGKEE